jgi:hypothetical protein
VATLTSWAAKRQGDREALTNFVREASSPFVREALTNFAREVLTNFAREVSNRRDLPEDWSNSLRY